MSTTNLIFYMMTASIWGSTWYSIKVMEGSSVSDLVSNLYRFSIAFLALVLYALIRRVRWQKLSVRDHIQFMIQGLLMFCVNYYLFSKSVQYVVSGLTSLAFSSIILFNVLFSSLFLKVPLTRSTVLGCFFGLLGLVVVFWKQLFSLGENDEQMYGVLYPILGALTASGGQILARFSQIKGIDVIQNCLVAMGYGVMWWILFVVLSGDPITFDLTPSYIFSLCYLALVGTCVAFLLYLTLIKNIGPGKAAYISVISPLIALMLSVCLEGYVWSNSLILGLVFVVMGNVLMVLRR